MLLVVLNAICLLYQLMATSHKYDIVAVAHVMEPAENSIWKLCLVSADVAIFEERLFALLEVGKHLPTDRRHLLAVVPVLVQSIHLLPR